MTSIDQSLLGLVPAKTGKATAKAGSDAGSTGSEAFGDVFAKASKKQDDRTSGKTDLAAETEPADAKTRLMSLTLPGEAKSAHLDKELRAPGFHSDKIDMPADEPAERTAKPKIDLRGEALLSIKTKPATKDDAAPGDGTGASADDAVVAADISKLMEMLSAPPQATGAADKRSVSTDDSDASILAEFHQLSALTNKADQKRETGASARSTSAPALDTAANETDTSENSDIFRFARADGKGKAVEMKLSALGDEARVSDRDTPKSRIENVTVLDSRRYLGLAANTSTNAGILTAAISGNSEWAAAMLPGSAPANATLADNTGKVVNTLKLQMHPIDLGSVTATLRLTGDALNVDLRVETSEAYRQLSDDQNGILKALRAQGFEVDQVNVVLVQSDPSTKATPSADGASQQQFNQSARDGAGNGTQQGRGQQDDNRQFAAGNARGARDGATDETAAAAGVQRGSPGHVYL